MQQSDNSTNDASPSTPATPVSTEAIIPVPSFRNPLLWRDILVVIFSHIPQERQIRIFRLVCKAWRDAGSSLYVWDSYLRRHRKTTYGWIPDLVFFFPPYERDPFGYFMEKIRPQMMKLVRFKKDIELGKVVQYWEFLMRCKYVRLMIHFETDDGDAFSGQEEDDELIALKPTYYRTTRVGGCPIMPEDVEWPQGFLFIAQIDVRDISHTLSASFLPVTGVLYFFCNPLVSTCRVVYTEHQEERNQDVDPELQSIGSSWEERPCTNDLQAYAQRPVKRIAEHFVTVASVSDINMTRLSLDQRKLVDSKTHKRLCERMMQSEFGLDLSDCDTLPCAMFGMPALAASDLPVRERLVLAQFGLEQSMYTFYISAFDLYKRNWQNVIVRCEDVQDSEELLSSPSIRQQ